MSNGTACHNGRYFITGGGKYVIDCNIIQHTNSSDTGVSIQYLNTG